ncbi:hypothetical protein GO730_39130 [Spirosoma sp. HMF3257]|uniref:Uncharacterized protein n=1 Tax=Spirosoma telluris TaxID=2183553 RepID=A0A327NFS3_9BACT|nr:hypothetical protein [Spirosoma telluris]RAI72904.1 hypothetical protein HMF3257_39045 [Spirosoma telluris]
MRGVKQQQVKTLINYADLIGGIPIYLFYNYCSDKATTDFIRRFTGVDVELYGCSYVNANQLSNAYLKGMKWKPIPNFTLIHPAMALPFFRLFELIGGSRIVDPSLRNSTINKAGADEVPRRLKEYSLDELVADDTWIKTSTTADTNILPSKDQLLKDQDNAEEFNPSFRIVFTDEGIQDFPSQFLMIL